MYRDAVLKERLVPGNSAMDSILNGKSTCMLVRRDMHCVLDLNYSHHTTSVAASEMVIINR